VPLGALVLISVLMPCYLLQHPCVMLQRCDMPDWLRSMCTLLKSGSTSLRSSNTTFTLTQ
jgi:hypothetical protein